MNQLYLKKKRVYKRGPRWIKLVICWEKFLISPAHVIFLACASGLSPKAGPCLPPKFHWVPLDEQHQFTMHSGEVHRRKSSAYVEYLFFVCHICWVLKWGIRIDNVMEAFYHFINNIKLKQVGQLRETERGVMGLWPLVIGA